MGLERQIRTFEGVIKISLYKKIIDEAIECTPMEKELAKQIHNLNNRLDTQENIIQSLSAIITKQVR